jgi:hypothetical protein
MSNTGDTRKRLIGAEREKPAGVEEGFLLDPGRLGERRRGSGVVLRDEVHRELRAFRRKRGRRPSPR